MSICNSNRLVKGTELTMSFPSARWRPWCLAGAVFALGVWHLWDFPEEVDTEFPNVDRPFFSAYSPAAYRLAEPGDTLDRVAMYLATAAIVTCVFALLRTSRNVAKDSFSRRGWMGAWALSCLCWWQSAAPWPTFDGWYGWNFRSAADPSAPLNVRILIGAGAAFFGGLLLYGGWPTLRAGWTRLVGSKDGAATSGRSGMIPGLLLALGFVWGFTLWPDVEPLGYWPRWGFLATLCVWNLRLLTAFAAMVGESAPVNVSVRKRRVIAVRVAAFTLWTTGTFAGIVLGVALIHHHRPLHRLKVIVPGRLYISAMPRAAGFAEAHSRHHFKTIVNLFPEVPPLRSPWAEEEQEFVRAHGIRYLESPGGWDPDETFLRRTLELSQDPEAWPILVHCHGCMDRTPAWTGLYRFLYQNWSLRAVFEEMERHRGLRPKASVFFLYQRYLSRNAAERYTRDPENATIRTRLAGTRDPYDVPKTAVAPTQRDAADAPRR